ncbi:hypothetical protein [Humibacillus xanthopallidus]|uniref:Uncharacterized protein n=1 Tax=Humibacillus xanthopallidus TaxID=412689 RepID=A0A543HHT1_9MICO|nr:hypothetical protein [Humibacillus xanthopallidus]TQM57837.1 hypothetical protein FBY41_3172 [Humibacillus xanthopallidus]
MSVATQLGLGDPESHVLAMARSRWPGWVSAHPVLGVVEDLLELPAWLRQADRDDADMVLLTLAELSSPEGGDDVAATGALAWVLLPGVSLLASRMFTLSPRIDQMLAAALWMEARTFRWQRGHRVAANVLMNARKAVMRDLGVGAAADPTWARTIPVAPTERIWEAMPAEPSESAETPETSAQQELAELLDWASAGGVITDEDRSLLVDVAQTADRQRTVRSGRGHAGLLGNDVSAEVAGRRGVAAITVRRHTSRAIQALRDAVGATTAQVPA